ncbi:MAG: Xaa-Pro dipeptidase, partial [Parasporobacterium sp.]|nr:Xaa-Pro dipeptidase [Parasporobacterium sp.]
MTNCDMHIHMALDGGYWKDAFARHKEAPDETWIRGVLSAYKDRGIDYLRDGGDKYLAGLKASELAGEYGITYRTPVFPICRK